ncbi:transporter substrate-binding domain-containing protein [Salinivibrio sp. ES.052]|uniref:transporter substrate-binding domain-containing protein n=1 Tax=Salinivibrio sp. ES.052 TaxID=1882823 RepID=UPI00092C797A|nr:transporter substrate-binding domain-containing protein [Salinivibrio sp. ES.052]SIO33981.1 extracellular solute-binding protein, family 3 [Salinivibrio sp. ES.052]
MKGLWALLLIISVTIPVHAKTTYVVGVQSFSQYYPYSAYSNRNYSGFNRELLDMFANEYHYRFVYKALPLRRLYHRFVDGVVDLKYPDSPDWSPDIKKDSEVIYSDPVVDYIDGVMVIDQHYGQPLNTLRTLGTVSGFTPKPYQSRISAGTIRLDESYKYDSLMMKVVSGRVDGGYANIAVAQFYLDQMGFKKGSVRFDDTLPHVKGTRRLSTIHYPKVIKEFNQFLAESEEKVSALKARYGFE